MKICHANLKIDFTVLFATTVKRNGTQLTARMRVHRQQINDPSIRNTPCSEHFDNCAMGNYQVFPFYKLKTESTSMRRVRENYFIKLFSLKLNTKILCI